MDLVEEATAKNKLLLNSLIRFNVTDPSAESVRICLTFSVICDWDIKLTDVSTAFLHADVIGNPYVFPPETEGLCGKNTVLEVK